MADGRSLAEVRAAGSVALIHLANASYRLGTSAPFGFAAIKHTINGDSDVAEAWTRMEDYLTVENGIKLADWPVTVGAKFTVDAEKEAVVGTSLADPFLT